jgi:hypothetical protein
MLQMRWAFPVGGVIVTLAVLALALNGPDAWRLWMPNVTPVRSAILELGEPPEWRQFVILSALKRRADELKRLRELPDGPTGAGIAPVTTAVPVEIDDIKLPVALAKEKSPVVKATHRVKMRNQRPMKGVRQVRRVIAPANRNSFSEPPFGNQVGHSMATNTNSYFVYQQARPAPTQKANNYFGNQPARTPTPDATNY